MGVGKLRESRPADTYYVSPSFADDVMAHKFNKVQDAIDYAAAHLPVLPRKVYIKVRPGVYFEQLTNTSEQIFIEGKGPGFLGPENPGGFILYNSGIDSAHYPISNDSTVMNLANMVIMVDSGNTFGETLPLAAEGCYFIGGCFVNSTSLELQTMQLRRCIFQGDGFNLSGVFGPRIIYCHDSFFYGGVTTLGNTDSWGLNACKMTVTSFSNNLVIGGNWSSSLYLVDFTEAFIPGEVNTITFGTTGNLSLDTAVLPGGIHFTLDSPGSKSILNCNFRNPLAASDHKDVSADVPITNVEYNGNVQQNGICGCIQIHDPQKHVGNGHEDSYFSLQDAVTSIPDGERGLIKLWENLINLPGIVLTNPGIDVGVDGQKEYSLTFAGDIVEIGAGQKVGFCDMVQLNGGNIELNGIGSEISFESCQYIVGHLTLTLGAFAIIYKSSFFGSTGNKAINISNVDTPMIVGYSRVQGSAGNPAVEFSVDADNKFKAKFSTFIHGDGGTNSPIVYTGLNKVDLAIYNSALNAAFDASDFHNTIGSPNNTVSAEISF